MQQIGFSKNLARIFYALAAADKRVHEAEMRTLKNLIRTAWPKLLKKKNELQSDQLYQIELEFDRLVEESSDPNNCFDEFVYFMKENREQFSQEIKELIWETANAIVHSFSGKNKSELILLTKLKMNLQQ